MTNNLDSEQINNLQLWRMNTTSATTVNMKDVDVITSEGNDLTLT